MSVNNSNSMICARCGVNSRMIIQLHECKDRAHKQNTKSLCLVCAELDIG